MSKSLLTKGISEDAWNKILSNASRKEKVKSIADYTRGYRDRNVIRYTEGTDHDSLVAESYYVYYVLGEEYDFTQGWKQIVCIKNSEQKESIIDGEVSPRIAVSTVYSEIYRHYSRDEVLDIFKSHEATKVQAEILHHNVLYGAGLQKGVIYKFTDCYYYDINGAYGTKLSELFPKCSDKFKYWFEHRHDHNNKFKSYFNHFVGCLTQNKDKMVDGKPTREIHPLTRFWIIQQITNQMYYALKHLGFKVKEDCVYLNTDGLIVQHPKHTMEHSKDMGKFKLEHVGDVYMYRTDAGWCMQYGDEIKGMVPMQLRDKIDLRQGKVVEYEIKRENGTKIPYNIQEKHYETIEIN